MISVLFWLLLASVISCAAVSCPENCFCSPTDIDCSSINLAHLPSSLPSSESVFVLSVAGNRIKNLPQKAFVSLKLLSLEVLELQSNHLETLSTGAFEGLPDLKTLRLSHNRLHVLSNGTFDHLNELRLLHLRYNDLQIIHDDAFRSLHKLQILDLSYNKLTTLSVTAFLHLRSVSQLKVVENSLVCDCEFRNWMLWVEGRRMNTGAICFPDSSHDTIDWDKCDAPKPSVEVLSLPTLQGFLEFMTVFIISYVLLSALSNINRNR
ncbi:leucine-rich repeat-containing protein 38 [Anabrus simplex]|uniref:leucine-rich repeat-containing protein 38 n=1 Tax=Anabrus simplex TaxID=316456 RepID=UPI0035A3B85B